MNKYRAWDKERGMMKCNGLFQGFTVAQLYNDDYQNYMAFVDEIILMQSTGLKDKNGVDIFEGDIVELIYEGVIFTGVTVYDRSEVDFKVTNGREEYGSNFCYLTGNDSNEIIGNIHANPELLNQKN